MVEPKNLVELFLSQVETHGDAVALRHKRDGRWIDVTWRQWESEVRRLARGLLQLGLRPKDAVTIASNNRPEWLCVDLATQMAGGILAPIYPTLTADDVRYINDNAQARFAVVENEAQWLKLQSVLSELPRLEKIILLHGAVTDERVITYEQLLAWGETGDDALLAERVAQIGPHDPATFIYTSGTTGRPKGAMLTHDNILFVTKTALNSFEVLPTDSVLSYLPLSHAFERIAVFYLALRGGVTISLAESIEKLGANLLEAKPSLLVAVPRVLEKVYAGIVEKTAASSPLRRKIFAWALRIGYATSPHRLALKPLPRRLAWRHRLAKRLVYDKIAARLGGRMRFIAVGGAPMSKTIAEFFHALDILVIEGYGMTECAAPATMNLPGQVRFGTVGKPLPGVEVRIAADGEVLVRGRNVFAGYFRLPEATAEALHDGWLHTGDVGEFEPDGMLRITDRKKDLIVTSSGKNIAPQKIENLLVADPFISQAVVIGDKRNYLTALIAPAMEALARAAREEHFELPASKDLAGCAPVIELIRRRVDLINKQLPRFETVKNFRLLENELTVESGDLTPTQKVRRKVVAEKYRDLIEQMYAPKAEVSPPGDDT